MKDGLSHWLGLVFWLSWLDDREKPSYPKKTSSLIHKSFFPEHIKEENQRELVWYIWKVAVKREVSMTMVMFAEGDFQWYGSASMSSRVPALQQSLLVDRWSVSTLSWLKWTQCAIWGTPGSFSRNASTRPMLHISLSCRCKCLRHFYQSVFAWCLVFVFSLIGLVNDIGPKIATSEIHWKLVV